MKKIQLKTIPITLDLQIKNKIELKALKKRLNKIIQTVKLKKRLLNKKATTSQSQPDPTLSHIPKLFT